MKKYAITIPSLLACMACTGVYGATNDATAPVVVLPQQAETVAYADTNVLGIDQPSTDVKDTPKLEIKKKGKKPVEPTPPEPVRIDADKMYYSDTTGHVIATGMVEVHRGMQTLKSPHVEGNTQTQQYESKGAYHFLEGNGSIKDLKGNYITYHADTGEAHTQDVFGYAAPYWVKAEKADFDGQVGHIEKGWLTTKNAIAFKGVPDYRMEGDYIEVYPEDKAIIHNAKFFVKNAKIASMKKYTVSLRQDKKGQLSIFSFIPRPAYNSTDGISLRGRIEYPLGDNGEAFFRYTLGSKVGFKPSFGYRHFLPWGEAKIAYSRESATLNARTVWIEKRPELTIDTKVYHIGSTPFTVRGGANIGQWKEDYLNGSHKGFYGEISHDRIRIGKPAGIRFYAGYQRDYYGYNSHVRSMPYWGVTSSTSIGPKVNAWIGYRQTNLDPRNDSPYPFDRIDVKHNFYFGASLRLTRLDRFSVSVQRDMQSHQLRYVDLTWHRDMHSFEGSLTYRTKQKKWEYTFVAKDF